MILARETILNRMKACKITPNHQIMDNEASAAYIKSIQDSDMDYKKVPPDDHQRNIAEQSNPNMEKPFCSCAQWFGQHFSTASMVPTDPTNRASTQSSQQLQHPSTHINVHTSARKSRLQFKTIRPDWNGNTNT